MIDCKMFRGCLGSVVKCEIAAVRDGVRAAGDRFEFSDKDYEPCDVAFHASGPKGTDSISQAVAHVIAEHRGPRLVLESPVFRFQRMRTKQDAYYRLSWNGFLRDEADYVNRDSPADRWEMIQKEQGIAIEPWRDSVGAILVCLQKEHDASLRGTDTYAWAAQCVEKLRSLTDEEIILRAHPKSRHRHRLKEIRGNGIRISTLGDIMQEFGRSRAVVTYTSLSAVESICAGLKTVAMNPGSMAWPVADHDLESVMDPVTPRDRTQWLYDLGYTQWKLSEIRKGVPWRRLKRVYWPD